MQQDHTLTIGLKLDQTAIQFFEGNFNFVPSIVLNLLKCFLVCVKVIALPSLRGRVDVTQRMRNGHAVGCHFGCVLQGSGGEGLRLLQNFD